jgi:chromosome segregation ATPase
MEYDQLIKKIEWMDDERRKDKTTIATLEDRIITLEGDKSGILKRVKDLEGEISRFSVMLSRFDQVDADIAQIKVDFSRTIDGIEKQRSDKDRESEKIRRADIESITKSIAEVRQGLEPIADLKKNVHVRVEEESRLARLLEEIKKEFDQFGRGEEDEKRTQRLLEENQRQDSKRIVDLQAEVAALRKRSDEQRGKQDLVTDNMRKLEMRLNELQASESERRQAQMAFIEKQNMLQVDRERVWKDWQARFAEIAKQANELNTQLQGLDTMNRTLKRSQAAFDEITQTFERRVNEITELQRLVEERFRQEWVTFKAEDQKRWTNYSLTKEEQFREFNRTLEKHTERLVLLEDMTQEIRDLSYHVISDTKVRLQKIMSISGELLEDYDRSFGNSTV